MKKFTFVASLVLVSLLAGQTAHSQTPSPKEAVFVSLFNGKNLDGWQVREARSGDKDKWSVKDGILVAEPGSGWIGTTKPYGDFVLKVEWRITEGGNSGVYIRMPEVTTSKEAAEQGLEVQILDDNDPKWKGKDLQPWMWCGSLYMVQGPSKKVFKGVGQWNEYEITCKGGQISVVFNGEKVVDVDTTDHPVASKRPKQGFIGFQNHGSKVEFRSVELKVLGEVKPPAVVSEGKPVEASREKVKYEELEKYLPERSVVLEEKRIADFSVSGDGKLILTCGDDIALWHARGDAGKAIARFSPTLPATPRKQPNDLTPLFGSVAFSKDQTRAFAVGSLVTPKGVAHRWVTAISLKTGENTNHSFEAKPKGWGYYETGPWNSYWRVHVSDTFALASKEGGYYSLVRLDGGKEAHQIEAEKLAPFTGGEFGYGGATFATGGQLVVVTGKEFGRIYSCDSGKEVGSLYVEGYFDRAPLVSPDGTRAFCWWGDVGGNHHWSFINMEEGTPEKRAEYRKKNQPPPIKTLKWMKPQQIASCAFSQDSRIVAIALSGDNSIRLCWASDGKEILKLPGHGTAPWLMWFCPTGRKLYTYEGSTLVAWDLFGKKRADEPDRPDGKRGGEPSEKKNGPTEAKNDTALLEFLKEKTAPQVRTLDHKGVTCLALSPDGKFLLSGGFDAAILWDVASGKEIKRFTPSLPARPEQVAKLTAHASSVGFSKDGKTAYTFSNLGRSIVENGSATFFNTVFLFDVESGKQQGYFDVFSSTKPLGCQLQFLPGTALAVSRGTLDGKVMLWDVANKKQVATFDALKVPGTALVDPVQTHILSPDGSRLLLLGAFGRVFDTKTGKEVAVLQWQEGYRAGALSTPISSDGKVTVLHLSSFQGGGKLALWDLEKGKQVSAFSGEPKDINCIAFSPGERVVGTGGFDKMVRLWDVASGKELRALEGHVGPITSVHFSPDGGLLVTAGGNSIRLWQMKK